MNCWKSAINASASTVSCQKFNLIHSILALNKLLTSKKELLRKGSSFLSNNTSLSSWHLQPEFPLIPN
jgi:hypothetical protein